MAFKSRQQVEDQFEKEVAAVAHYSVRNEVEARNLFNALRTREERLVSRARRERTVRHLAEHPDDLEARAGMVVYEECDVLTSHLDLYMERAVEAAMAVLDERPSESPAVR